MPVSQSSRTPDLTPNPQQSSTDQSLNAAPAAGSDLNQMLQMAIAQGLAPTQGGPNLTGAAPGTDITQALNQIFSNAGQPTGL